jgi:hypothetical protein
MNHDELQYSPQQFDYIEGRAQDVLFEPIDDSNLSEPLSRFLGAVTPVMVVKMVRIVRRLRYLLECSQEDVTKLKLELEKVREKSA